MRYSYVMTVQDSAGMLRRRNLLSEDVSGSLEELTGALRPWAMAYLREDILWYRDMECVPVSSQS